MLEEKLALAEQAFTEGDYTAAAIALDEVLRIDPENCQGLCNAGYLAYLRGDFRLADDLLSRGAQKHSHYAPMLNNLGLLRQAQRSLEEAESCYRRAVSLDANDPLAIANLGSLLLLRGAVSEATTLLQSAMRIAPDNPSVFNAFALCRQEVADTQTASRLFLRAWELAPARLELRNNWLMSLLYEPVANSRTFQEADRKAFGERRVDHYVYRAEGSAPAGSESPLRRIGFLSADLYHHPVGLIVERMLEGLATVGVTPFFYAPEAPRDAVGETISSAGVWRETRGLDDAHLAKLIADDKLDALLDLSGLTAGSRAGVFSFRPSPRQIAWLGLPACSGSADADGVLIARDLLGSHGDSFFNEPVLRIDAPPFLLPRFSKAPPVASLPALANGFLTFGCFNNPAKLNDDCLALWAGVLRQASRSELLIKHRSAIDPAYQSHLRQRFETEGIASTRIRFAGASSHTKMLEEYAGVDIALDPYPFNGGMTTMEALWMGVPVLTLTGLRPVSRQGLAILRAADLGDWVHDSPADMWRAAAEWSNELDALKDLRAGMRSRLEESALGDAPAYANALVQALQQMPANKA